ncbi:MAG: sporulation transcription factor Spo0A [Clostridiales bacterium]|jgi:two-component system response regulator (stage 0 sporulation protein A)|nr:sporulation transcription factor Spo0A [Eubacteriales bacterium]MDH7567174.1 sporulation transcription factor Spo0A [Clostridiales bacterium]
MSDIIKVLIADDNLEFGDLLCEYLKREEDLNIVGVARDGIQTLEMIASQEPDVVILDVVMPNLDGIGVLENISRQKPREKPLFIMLSAIGQDIFVQRAISLGAEYYLVKPFDADVLISRIRQIYREKNLSPFSSSKPFSTTASKNYSNPETGVNSLEMEVTNIMHDIGIPPHISGYQYIREAILQSLNNPNVFTSITKFLYPAVASKFNSTPQKVERAIRNAIETTWSKGNAASIDSLFGYTINYNRGKPTNSEFIAMIVDQIKIAHGGKK